MIRRIFDRIHRGYRRMELKRLNNQVPSSCRIGKGAYLRSSILEEDAGVAEHASVLNSRVGRLASIGRYSKVTHTSIGAFSAIAWDVTINAVGHPHSHLTVNAFPYVPYVGGFVKQRTQVRSIVRIGHDVWVGANSVVMPGITIGDGAVIGAGAVVTKDVPNYAIVAGVPAKVIGFRFDEETVSRLLDLRWWELDNSIIKANVELFQTEFTSDSLKKLERICTEARFL